MFILFTILFQLIFSVNTFSNLYSDSFHEELLIKRLSSGHVYSYFQFTTLWNTTLDKSTFDHTHLWPRSLGEILGYHNVQELHVSLTQGLWRYQNWGYPVVEAPPGAELWVWFKPDTENVEKEWKLLAGALSGLLCASLNFIETSNSMTPELSFRPVGVADISNPVNSSFLRYATLPREIVCTENLTPLKKLLPCDSKKGLSTLLNAGYVHNTNYHSLGLHFRQTCSGKYCVNPVIELRQTVSLVYDLSIVEPINQDWSIRKLFGVGVGSGCPLASSSRIYVDISSNETGPVFHLTPNPDSVALSMRGGYQSTFAVYDISSTEKLFNINANYRKLSSVPLSYPPPLYVNRYIAGYGQERGRIVTKIHNKHRTPLKIIYLENIPWFMPIYYHTLKVTANNRNINPIQKRYHPGKERVRPYFLEVVLEIPARTSIEVHFEFDYIFLKWQEYPPDANHGFYVGSAVITCMLPVGRNYTGLPPEASLISDSWNASQQGYLVQLRTESLILTLPTPDFSMPYNVICLACTVVALAFGPLHNITTKRLQLVKLDEEPKGVFPFLKNKVLKPVKNFFKKTESTVQAQEQTAEVSTKSKES